MRNPILVGVADIKNRSTKPEDAIEPLHLISRAVQDALNDTGLPPSNINKLRASIDAISVVRTWTWPYADLPGLLSNELGIKPKHKHYTAHGGNQPAKLADDAARRIAKGESVMEVIAGGEALGSCECFIASLYHGREMLMSTQWLPAPPRARYCRLAGPRRARISQAPRRLI